MELIPFLIASFLLINPLLEWIFRKVEIPTEKLQFWVMVTTGTAWVIALAAFLLFSGGDVPPVSPDATDILPRLAFSLDWISGSLILSAAGLVFVTVLTRQNIPQANAWLAGIGGACVIGLGSNSAYTLGLTWVIIEGFHFYISYRDWQIAANPRKYLPIVLLRLSAPGSLILLALTQNEPGGAVFLAELDPGSGPIMVGAGLLGFLGWFLSFQGYEEDRSMRFPGAVESWLPGLLGLLLIARGGAISEVGASLAGMPWILSCSLLAAALAGTLLDLTPELWFLSCGLMASVSAIISGAESALSWGVVIALPGTQLWKGRIGPRTALIPLVFASVGLLPIPYLPAWAGISAFSAGVPGIILGISYGILLGSALVTVLKKRDTPENDLPTLPLLGIIAAAAALVSQVVIAFKLDLLSSSQEVLSKPVTIWISVLGLVLILILGNHLPLKKRANLRAALSRLSGAFWGVLQAIVHTLDRLVRLISRIFEGQAGLIWALLIGLLLITLISLGGG